MDRNGIGLFQFVKFSILIKSESPAPGLAKPIVIEGHGHGLGFFIDAYDPSDLAVKDALAILSLIAFFSAVATIFIVAFPLKGKSVIVLYLHYPVAFSKDLFAEFELDLVLFRGIEDGLKERIQFCHS